MAAAASKREFSRLFSSTVVAFPNPLPPSLPPLPPPKKNVKPEEGKPKKQKNRNPHLATAAKRETTVVLPFSSPLFQNVKPEKKPQKMKPSSGNTTEKPSFPPSSLPPVRAEQKKAKSKIEKKKS